MAETKIAKGYIYLDTEGMFRWRTVGGNGEPMGYGESYRDIRDARAALEAHIGEDVEVEEPAE
jgi:uncharacterized protein YegP (UPF0339 family)